MTEARDQTTRRLRVWDTPTRLFHWLLVAMVAVAWASGDEESVFWLHQLAGYGVLTALLFRLGWGFVGGEHARWAAFLRGPAVVKSHLRAVAAFRPPRMRGHNPAGGWMVVALMFALVALAASGLHASDDGLSGPLAGQFGGVFADLHEMLATALWLLVGVHVAGVLLESSLTRDNLVAAMWRGWKSWPSALPAKHAVEAPSWHAAITLACASGVVWWLVMS